MLAGEILRLAAARFPDKNALIDGDHRLTYREFDRAANRAAHALLALGLKKGSRAAILSAAPRARARRSAGERATSIDPASPVAALPLSSRPTRSGR